MDEDDPVWRAWVDDVQHHLLPKLEDSSITLSLVPDGEADIKFAVELGLSIMLDKPIILMVTPGVHVPAHLAKVADGIIEWDPDDPMPQQEQMHAKLKRFLDEFDPRRKR